MTAAPLARKEAHASVAPPVPAVRRLRLRDFRNYRSLDLAVGSGPIVLAGENGAGKTNLLEAVSLLAPGRGLRRARLDEMDRQGGGPWQISLRLDTREGPQDVETRRQTESERRDMLLDGSPLRGQGQLAEIVSLVWLTPAMDRVFVEGPSNRRRFLDRLVLAIDPSHASRVAAFERSMAERSQLLRTGRSDPAWLGAIERRMVESGVAVAAARRTLLADLERTLAADGEPFPRPHLAVEGELERWLEDLPAVEVEDRFAAGLAAARGHDSHLGGASIGPHRSDLVATDAANGEPARLCSTGRQKAFLCAIVLAEARLRRQQAGDLPILLLDEATAHLDPGRRADLFDALIELGAQTWLSGTDAELFAPLRGHAAFYRVAQGILTPDE